MIVGGLRLRYPSTQQGPEAGGQRLPVPIAFREGPKPSMVIEGTSLGCFALMTDSLPP